MCHAGHIYAGEVPLGDLWRTLGKFGFEAQVLLENFILLDENAESSSVQEGILMGKESFDSCPALVLQNFDGSDLPVLRFMASHRAAYFSENGLAVVQGLILQLEGMYF